MIERTTIGRRQAIKLGILGAFPFRPDRFVHSPPDAGNIQITQAMTPAVKKGYQVVDGNEEEFANLILTVKNTGDDPVTISRQLANDYLVGYVLSGVPYPVADWKNKAIGWGDEVAPGKTVELTIHGANKANYGPLQFDWDMEKKVLRRIPDQFHPEQRTFPDDYAQGETYTATFGFFIEGADGDTIPVTDNVPLQYSGGMEKFDEFNSVSYWVPSRVTSVDGKQTPTPSQTDSSEENDETPTPQEDSESAERDITVKTLRVDPSPNKARVVGAVLDFGGYDELDVGVYIEGGRYEVQEGYEAGTVTPQEPGFELTFSTKNNMALQSGTQYTVQTFALVPTKPAETQVLGTKKTFVTPTRGPDGDLDKDNLPNGKERDLGTDPRNPDTDDDGWTDGEEYVANTDPTDPDDHP